MGCLSRNVAPFWKILVVIFAPLIVLPLPVLAGTSAARCGYVIIVMAAYWMTEAIPLAITALLPVFAFPLLGIMETNEVCSSYINSTNMLFIGGLMVAIAVEHSGLHRRIALLVIFNVGQSASRLMVGFMFTAMFLSMWISNVAATAMMVPIVDAILDQLYVPDNEEDHPPSICHQISGFDNVCFSEGTSRFRERRVSSTLKREPINQENDGIRASLTNNDEKNIKSVSNDRDLEKKHMRKCLLLATAYASNIGGTGTIPGTGPNLVLMGILDESFTEPTGITFGSWMIFNVPGMFVCAFFGWIWLQFLYLGLGRKTSKSVISREKEKEIKKIIGEKYAELGTISFHEASVLTLFVFLVSMWVFREPGFIEGWSIWFKNAYGINLGIADATPALLIVFLLFVVPAKPNFWPFRYPGDPTPPSSSTGCLTWEIIHEKMPWGIILLLGGGFAMANASDESGLSTYLGEQLKALDIFPTAVILFFITLIITMATEVVSNTATASILLPVLKELSLGLCVNPLYLMLPATICCSYAFMLPVATAPNAIVYGAGKMKTISMMRAGFPMNIICVIIINISINTLGVALFDLRSFPSWANSTTSGQIPEC